MTGTQFGHISQFYETLLTVAIFVLAIFQVLSLVFNIHVRLSKQIDHEHQSQLQWTKQKIQIIQKQQNQNPQVQQRNELQKSVANYVQNEITNMQKAIQEPKQSEQPKPDQQKQMQIPPNKLSFYRMYLGFHNFINQRMAILIPILVLGILTQSTYVYSLAALFFSFLCDLIVEILAVQQQINRSNSSGFSLKTLVKILGHLFVLSIFISYWDVKQFNPS